MHTTVSFRKKNAADDGLNSTTTCFSSYRFIWTSNGPKVRLNANETFIQGLQTSSYAMMETTFTRFDVLLTADLSVILVINQLDAKILVLN